MDALPKDGSIEVICGCMFGGKTEELIRRVRRALIAKQKVRVFKFKPYIDNRYVTDQVKSHDGLGRNAVPVACAEDILRLTEPDTTVVAIDEAQFFDDALPRVVNTLADHGKRVICAGLDLDFRGEPFGPMPTPLAIAERVDKLIAICAVSGELATRIQRTINGKPASYHNPIILVGATESYEARARKYHNVPDKP